MKNSIVITPALMEEMAQTIVQSEAYQRKLASAKAAYERDKESLKKMLPKRD